MAGWESSTTCRAPDGGQSETEAEAFLYSERAVGMLLVTEGGHCAPLYIEGSRAEDKALRATT